MSATVLAHTSPVEHGVLVVLGAGAVAVYGWAWLRRPQRSRRRLACWFAGVVVLLVATTASVERLAEESFTGHMVQHLLLLAVAAPLLVLARPFATLRRGGVFGSGVRHPWGWWSSVAQWWRSAAPLVGAAGFIAVLYLTHLTGIYDAALGNRLVHDVEHVAYLVCGTLLWSTVGLGAGRSAPARIGAVFAVIAGGSMLGVVLLSASTPLMDTYEELLGPAEALDDQRRAASLMWIGGMAVTLPLLLTGVWGWASAEQRRTERAEAIRSELAQMERREVAASSVGGRPRVSKTKA